MFINPSFPKSNPNDYINIDYSNKDNYPIDSVGRPIGACPVDQFDSQSFMMGENGFRRSDIAILVSAESEDLKRAIAARIVEINSNFPDQSLSDSELAAMAIPRNCQSSSMIRDWAASLEKSGFAKAVDAFVKANTPDKPDDTIKFDSPTPSIE